MAAAVLQTSIATSRLDPDTTGRPPTLEVRHPDAGLAFVVDQTTLLGSAWDGSGGLAVLTADAPLFPDHVVLDVRDPSGVAGAPILEIGTSAQRLGISTGALSKLLLHDDSVGRTVNDLRRAKNMRPLR